MHYMLENSKFDLRSVTEELGHAYVERGLKNENNLKRNVLVMMLCTCFFILVCGVVIFPMVKKVESNKIRVLSLYSEMKKSVAREALQECLTFHKSIQINTLWRQERTPEEQ